MNKLLSTKHFQLYLCQKSLISTTFYYSIEWASTEFEVRKTLNKDIYLKLWTEFDSCEQEQLLRAKYDKINWMLQWNFINTHNSIWIFRIMFFFFYKFGVFLVNDYILSDIKLNDVCVCVLRNPSRVMIFVVVLAVVVTLLECFHKLQKKSRQTIKITCKNAI